MTPNIALQLISPRVAPVLKSQAEVFGAMTWLWMNSPTHQACPLGDLHRLLLPALSSGQYVLALSADQQQRPLGLLTWAMFTHETERKYLATLDRYIKPEDWTQGDRPWTLDWVTPFGQAKQFMSEIRRSLRDFMVRGLYHRGDEVGLKVLHFRSRDVSLSQQNAFWSTRPLSAPGSRPTT